MSARSLFLAFLLWATGMVAYGQNSPDKKVAIAETVDKENKVSYPIEMMIRSSLTKAIANKPGYVAFDRVDIQSIMGEQNFQRTGMVSDASIKKLGEMTGAGYVLIAEAVLFDQANLYVTAKILDVETAQTDIIESQLMGTGAADIQDGCELLASSVLGMKHAFKDAVGTEATGFVRYNDVFEAMPETKEAHALLDSFSEELKSTAKGLLQQYNQQFEVMKAHEKSWSSSVREQKIKELQQLQARYDLCVSEGQTAFAEKTNELGRPLHEKLRRAIEAVRVKNGYTHIWSDDQVITFDPECDVTDQVKAELGIE